MIETYLKHLEERAGLGVPPLPLTLEQTNEVCNLLQNPPAEHRELLLGLLVDRVPPGVDPAAKIKADFLSEIAKGTTSSPLINQLRAVELLGTMLGGYNVPPLIELLSHTELADAAADALSGTLFVFDAFDDVIKLSKAGVAAAERVIRSWAEAEWFTRRPAVAEEIKVTVFKVDGEINTDDFSPAKHAPTRPDIPLHALAMGESRFRDGNDKIRELRERGLPVAFVGDVVGTGSSRKSACNSLIWHIGEEIPHVPNKRAGGFVVGGVIAPIFFNTAEDSGALPLQCDVTGLATGDTVTIRPRDGEIRDASGSVISHFDIKPVTLLDEYRAGGRVPLIIGKQLTDRARQALGMGENDLFATAPVIHKEGVGYSLAQKMVGKACGLDGVHPGSACLPKMTTVGSQDTTGPMTRDEIKELACLKFQADLFMQSFCHTAAYPREIDVKMHQTLPGFMTERGGIALKPGDGVIHSWLNRMILPDTVGTGGDSHTRFPIGVSFPAGSGLVAFAGALGMMPLEMPESVLVQLSGALQPGITLRDVVNAIPYFAIQQGLLTVEKRNKKNVFNGRVLEIEGLPELSVEQAFELTDATAERSAAAGTIALSPGTVSTFLKSNLALLRSLIADGYLDADTINRRIEAMQAWLQEPSLLVRDDNAEYAATIEIDLGSITEPILACPNDPDDVKLLSEVAGTAVDEVFIGSCMTNIGHFRAAARILDGAGTTKAKLWVTPPTRMDRDQLAEEGVLAIFESNGSRIEIPGCSLCMGNQARVDDNAVVFSTSTRNFDNRIGDGAQVYLGSAELAAVCALLGKIPTPAEFLQVFNQKIAGHEAEIYRYLSFDQIDRYAKN
jgi:aconitate hydratase 2/2-methylisocitrate dehydratase